MEVPANDVWVVVAAYNEGQVIGRVVAGCRAVWPNVVVVDDGSSDDTGVAARGAGAVVLRHIINLGQGAALQTGIDYALAQGARFLVTFDADGQHRVDDIAPMLAALEEARADVVLGSRFLGQAIGLPRLRRVMLKAAVLFTWATTGLRLTDAHNGLRVLTARAAGAIRIRQNGMAHASEIIEQIARHRLICVEHPVTVLYSTYSRAKGQKLSNSVAILADLMMGRILR
jgi:glycosyltransferase involved in cell wall biosynthesis